MFSFKPLQILVILCPLMWLAQAVLFGNEEILWKAGTHIDDAERELMQRLQGAGFNQQREYDMILLSLFRSIADFVLWLNSLIDLHASKQSTGSTLDTLLENSCETCKILDITVSSPIS